MVTITAGSALPLDFSTLDIANLLDGDITSRSSTSLRLDLGGGDIVLFTGTGFTYNHDGDPIGGTISGIKETVNGVLAFDLTGASTPVSQFVDWVLTGASLTALQTIFSGNDVLNGVGLDEVIGGFGGHDNLFGGAGSDSLYGGDGNDHLYGQSANGGTDSGDLIYGEAGSDYIQGNMGNDSLDGGSESDRIQGGQGNDSIRAGEGNDTVNGNLGNDSIDGASGNDSLRGGQGNDSISGGEGNDILSGDLGIDSLSGGTGADIFTFAGQSSTLAAGADRITDYVDGTDHIALGFVPAAILTGSQQASLSAAQAAAQQLFDGHAGNAEVAAISVGTDSYILYSSSGGATVDSAILIANVSSGVFGAGDFI